MYTIITTTNTVGVTEVITTVNWPSAVSIVLSLSSPSMMDYGKVTPENINTLQDIIMPCLILPTYYVEWKIHI